MSHVIEERLANIAGLSLKSGSHSPSMERWMIRFTAIVGLPIYLALDRLIDGHLLTDSWRYYTQIIATGELL
jgi:hypothetical protein